MRAGAAADSGIDANNGNKNIDNKNKIEVTKAVRPVLPPAEIPEPDSKKVVTVEVPKKHLHK